MFSDLKYAVRQVAKNPGFAAIVVLILALGIGSNTAVFAAADALLLRGLPVREPRQLALVGVNGIQNFTGRLDSFAYPAFQQFRDRARSLSDVVAINSARLSVLATAAGQDSAVNVRADEVSGNFFSALGVPPFLGRTLTPDDDREQAPRAVVVLSHAYWQRSFGGDPSILGQTIQVEKVSCSVVGIAPPGFFGVTPGVPTDLWLPLQMAALVTPSQAAQFHNFHSFWLHLMGRLRPGVSRETAAAELDLLFQGELANEGLFRAPAWAKVGRFGRVNLLPGGSGFLPDPDRVTSLLTILLVVTGFVLVIACANVTSLLQAKIAVRQRELAVRMALGAGRGRVLRQLVTESLLFAAAGGVFGLILAHWGALVLFNYLPGRQTLDLSPDGRVLLFATGLSGAAAVCIGLVPALRVSRLGLMSVLKAHGQSVAGGSQRASKTLVIGQIAISVCLLAGAGLFVRTLENLKNVDLGFRRDDLLLVNAGFDRHYNAARRAILLKGVLAGLQALPGVRNVTVFTGGLLNNSMVQAVQVDGYVPRGTEQMSGHLSYVSPGYFTTVGTPLLHGREFNDEDMAAMAGQSLIANDAAPDPKAPAAPGLAIINEAFARQFFRGGDPLGHIIRGGAGQPYRIVGVVGNSVYDDLRVTRAPEFYLPFSALNTSGTNTLSFQVHTSQDPLTLTAGIRAALQQVDPKITVSFRTMDDLLDNKLAQERLVARLSSSFSLFALMLACLGLYGVLTFNVTMRTREIGVRMALGAQTKGIVALVVGQGVRLALIGCGIGVAAALALSRLISSSLYGVPAADPLTFAAVVALLLVVALLACLLPAWRAARVDPLVALRAE
jgi:predicted permease